MRKVYIYSDATAEDVAENPDQKHYLMADDGVVLATHFGNVETIKSDLTEIPDRMKALKAYFGSEKYEVMQMAPGQTPPKGVMQSYSEKQNVSDND